MLILGVPHFAQLQDDYACEAFGGVVGTLTGFDPHLVAVEYLPTDWPRGEGRDCLPDLDVEGDADVWGLTVNEAGVIVDGEVAADDPCELGRAYLVTYDLVYDLVNAYHRCAAHDCDELTVDDEPLAWSAQVDEHEISRIASPVAWRTREFSAHIEVRNERMFNRLLTAVEAGDAERILVVVGAGHRYFLDELAREHGYRWVDPGDWLPEPS